jgi:hypothetical protein
MFVIFNLNRHLLTGCQSLVYWFIGYKMKIRLAVLILVGFGVVITASAMDRWAALSMIESGDDDNAIGPGGEISRFQIRHKLWPGGDPQNPKVALIVARKIMEPRLATFQQSHKREATDFEFYILWNAPWQADHPSAVVTERARRFANLVELVPR